jgi:hypothetical protein
VIDPAPHLPPTLRAVIERGREILADNDRRRAAAAAPWLRAAVDRTARETVPHAPESALTPDDWVLLAAIPPVEAPGTSPTPRGEEVTAEEWERRADAFDDRLRASFVAAVTRVRGDAGRAGRPAGGLIDRLVAETEAEERSCGVPEALRDAYATYDELLRDFGVTSEQMRRHDTGRGTIAEALASSLEFLLSKGDPRDFDDHPWLTELEVWAATFDELWAGPDEATHGCREAVEEVIVAWRTGNRERISVAWENLRGHVRTRLGALLQLSFRLFPPAFGFGASGADGPAWRERDEWCEAWLMALLGANRFPKPPSPAAERANPTARRWIAARRSAAHEALRETARSWEGWGRSGWSAIKRISSVKTKLVKEFKVAEVTLGDGTKLGTDDRDANAIDKRAARRLKKVVRNAMVEAGDATFEREEATRRGRRSSVEFEGIDAGSLERDASDLTAAFAEPINGRAIDDAAADNDTLANATNEAPTFDELDEASDDNSDEGTEARDHERGRGSAILAEPSQAFEPPDVAADRGLARRRGIIEAILNATSVGEAVGVLEKAGTDLGDILCFAGPDLRSATDVLYATCRFREGCERREARAAVQSVTGREFPETDADRIDRGYLRRRRKARAAEDDGRRDP